MKRNLLLWAVCAVMMAFTACTQEKVVYVEEEKNDMNLQPGEGIIEISLASAISRAARPIDHFDPEAGEGNNVNRIGFRVYHLADEGGYEIDNDVKIVGVDESTVSEQPLNDYVIEKSNLANSPSVKIKIKIDGEVHSPYSIVAYGYNCTSGIEFPYKLDNQTQIVDIDNVDTEVNIVGLQCDMTEESFPEEIFAGQIKANVNEYGLFVAENTLILERQVAGMLVYLEGVPSHVDNQKVAKVTISTIMDVTGLKFPSNDTDNGIVPENNFEQTDLLTFQFKGNPDVSNYETVSFNGGDYTFSREVIIDGDGETKRYLFPKEMDEDVKQYLDENIECKNNTLFGSCFLLPFPATNTSHNFGGNNGNWNALNIVYWNESDQIIKAVPLKDTNSTYSIERNHFYSIGTKKTADIPEGDGETGNPQDDPLDIGEKTGYDYYFVTIDDAWDGNFSLKK